MNRRTFLSALAATSLTPLVPPQIFAAGAIEAGSDTVCLVGGTTKAQAFRFAKAVISFRASDDDEWQDVADFDPVGPDPILDEFMYGSGTWSGGLINTNNGHGWAEKTQADIAADINHALAALSRVDELPPDRVIWPVNRYTRLLRT